MMSQCLSGGLEEADFILLQGFEPPFLNVNGYGKLRRVSDVLCLGLGFSFGCTLLWVCFLGYLSGSVMLGALQGFQ